MALSISLLGNFGTLRMESIIEPIILVWDVVTKPDLGGITRAIDVVWVNEMEGCEVTAWRPGFGELSSCRALSVLNGEFNSVSW
jgi:hypothetical protein